MSSSIVRDGSVSGGVPEIVAFRSVAPDVFDERAQRLNALAPGHRLGAYLDFASRLCRAQHSALHSLPNLPPMDEQMLARCRQHAMPPLSVDGHPRHAIWRTGLLALLEAFDRKALPAPVASILESLRSASGEALEAAATNLLSGHHAVVETASAPFIGAALQVYWVKMALQLGTNAVNDPAQIGLCPVCGSSPLASIVRIGGAQQGLRYLVCSLCCCEWHMVRVKCAACGSTKGISYLSLEGASEAVKAECCDECRTYLKIFYLEKDTGAVPAADDLASLDLDILVDDAGYQRVGANLLFAPGHSA